MFEKNLTPIPAPLKIWQDNFMVEPISLTTANSKKSGGSIFSTFEKTLKEERTKYYLSELWFRHEKKFKLPYWFSTHIYPAKHSYGPK